MTSPRPSGPRGRERRRPVSGVGVELPEIPVHAPELLVGAGGDFPADAYEDAGTFEQLIGYWYRPRARMIAWALASYFPEARSFLDSGCGSGSVLEAIRAADPRIELTGADASLEALEIARRRVPRLEVLQAGAHDIPFAKRFDAAGCFDVLEHLEDDLGALVELAGTVSDGGGVLVTVPQHPWLWSEYDESAGHKRRYRRGELIALFAEAGLEPLRVSSYLFSLLPLIAAARRRPALSGDGVGPRPRIAAALEHILDAEVAAFRRGVSFRAGGSLFVVARKPGGGK